MASNGIERKIYFYRIDCGIDKSGKPIPFKNLSLVLRDIDSLQFTSSPSTTSRYMQTSDGNDIGVWIDDLSKGQIKIALIRRNGLPQQEDLGNLTNLPLLANGGLAETSHIVFFDNNIVGVEFNFYGPRISRLAEYFLIKSINIPKQFKFNQLLMENIKRELDKFSEIRWLNLRIIPSYSSIIRRADESLASSFEAAASLGYEDIQLVLKKPNKSILFDHRKIEYIKEIISKILSNNDVRQFSQKFQIRGKKESSERLEDLDLLGDALISKKIIAKTSEKSRAVDSNSAYNAIYEAYYELRSQLEEASSIDNTTSLKI